MLARSRSALHGLVDASLAPAGRLSPLSRAADGVQPRRRIADRSRLSALDFDPRSGLRRRFAGAGIDVDPSRNEELKP
jgi:hypothetical protein